MNLQEAYDYLTKRIHETPFGSPKHLDYVTRRKRIKRMMEEDYTDPPAA